jgi:outer membrane protein OmpA-like peptidoglycan-associated protein
MRKKAFEDSVNNAKATREKAAKELLAEKKKHTEDSIATVKVAQQKLAQELAEQKKLADDSIAAYKTAQMQIAKEMAEKKKLDDEDARIKKKALEDSIAEVNAAKERMAREQAERKPIDNSLAKEIQATTTAATTVKTRHAIAVAVPENVVIRESDTPTANMKAVFFNKNSYDFSSVTVQQLKEIVQALVNDPTAHLNIYGLASTGESNPRQISLRRSDVVLRYLLQAGIPVNRIRSFYYGNNISRNGCTNLNCPEELLQQNRCVVYDVVN